MDNTRSMEGFFPGDFSCSPITGLHHEKQTGVMEVMRGFSAPRAVLGDDDECVRVLLNLEEQCHAVHAICFNETAPPCPGVVVQHSESFA